MADTTNPFGGAAGSTGGMFGGGMWGSPQPSPYGGYGGMQSPYGGGYGGFGGGMPYGGGYGMQSPYGGSYGGYGGMQSPYGGYGMQQPYGGYGMQSPYGGYGAPQQGYGGYSPYGMPSQYGPQPSYGMPQQQTMMAPQVATQEGATAAGGDVTTTSDVTPAGTFDDAMKNIGISGNTTQTNRFDPWGPQQEQLRRYLTGTTGRIVDGKAEEISAEGLGTKGAMSILYEQQQAGPLGFDPQSEAALKRMQAMSTGANPMVGAATDATQDIASGQARIGTGGMFQDLYRNPGIQNLSQYGDMYQHPGITVDPYGDMYRRDAITNASAYNQAAAPISGAQFNSIYGQQQGQGSLSGGKFGQVASGGLMDSNPYREQAIRQSMADTADQVKATMSSRGRYGSDAYGDAMGTALGKVATQARMAGYDTDTANMMAAAQARSGEALSRGGLGLQAAQGGLSVAQQNAANRMAAAQGISGIQGQNYNAQMSALQGMNSAQQMANQQRMAAAQGLTGAQGQNWQNQLGAAQGLTGINSQDLQNRLAAAGMAPAMQGLRYDDINRQLQAGATREAMAQQQKNYGWDQLRQFQGIVGGVPGSAGTSKGTEQTPWWQSALGAGALAGGIWGQFNPPAA